MSQQRLPLVVLVGPTAVGKTACAIQLALRLHGEIVTADSMQIYKGMDIGTDKPTVEERQGVPHHLIDVVTPDKKFNVAMYRDAAQQTIARIHERGKLPIVSGGTGLYIRAILQEFLFPDKGSDAELRKKLQREAEQFGAQYLHDQLASVDSTSAKRIHPNDVRRVIRALEVYHTTGKTITEHIKQAKPQQERYNAVRIGLTRPRKQLYERINNRVDALIARGLVEEVKQLYAQYEFEKTALQGLGYKEIIAYLRGEYSLQEAITTLKQKTRRYAKRQLTWFRRDPHIRWFDANTYATPDALTDDLVQHICSQLPTVCSAHI